MEISRQVLDNNIVLVQLNGRLDAHTSAQVKSALQEVVDQENSKKIIDLEQVPFIDSSGMAALVSGLRSAREKNGNIALSGAGSQAQVVFRLTMLDRIFGIHPTTEEAKRSLM